jgi:hypothetical protein
MDEIRRGWSACEWLIVVGAGLFIFALFYSAYLEPDIRWLHFFQSWMYVAAVVFSLRRSRWGYFIGVSIGAFWDYGNLFVTTFLRSGVRNFSASIASGHILRPDQMIAIPAWFGNLLLVIGCVWAYCKLSDKKASDVWKFVVAFAVCTGYFWLDIAICQPRYLGFFRALLHPHAP